MSMTSGERCGSEMPTGMWSLIAMMSANRLQQRHAHLLHKAASDDTVFLLTGAVTFAGGGSNGCGSCTAVKAETACFSATTVCVTPLIWRSTAASTLACIA